MPRSRGSTQKLGSPRRKFNGGRKGELMQKRVCTARLSVDVPKMVTHHTVSGVRECCKPTGKDKWGNYYWGRNSRISLDNNEARRDIFRCELDRSEAQGEVVCDDHPDTGRGLKRESGGPAIRAEKTDHGGIGYY